MNLGDTVYLDFITSNPATGAAQNADSLPEVVVFDEDNDTPLVSLTVVNRTTGDYRATLAATVGNGFAMGRNYNVVVSATVSGTTGKSVLAALELNVPVDAHVVKINDETIAGHGTQNDPWRPA